MSKPISENVILMSEVPGGLPVVKVCDILGDGPKMERIVDLVNKGEGGIVCVGWHGYEGWFRSRAHTVYSDLDTAPSAKVGDYIIDRHGNMWKIMGLQDDDVILQLGGEFEK